MTRLMGGMLASNVAHDPSGRLSAHGIFDTVQAEGSFTFESPFYAIVNLLDVPLGKHTMGVQGSEGVVLSATPVEFDYPNTTAIVVVAVNRCELKTTGRHELYVDLDGNRLDGYIVVTISQPPETAPNGTKE